MPAPAPAPPRPDSVLDDRSKARGRDFPTRAPLDEQYGAPVSYQQRTSASEYESQGSFLQSGYQVEGRAMDARRFAPTDISRMEGRPSTYPALQTAEAAGSARTALEGTWHAGGSRNSAITANYPSEYRSWPSYGENRFGPRSDINYYAAPQTLNPIYPSAQTAVQAQGRHPGSAPAMPGSMQGMGMDAMVASLMASGQFIPLTTLPHAPTSTSRSSGDKPPPAAAVTEAKAVEPVTSYSLEQLVANFSLVQEINRSAPPAPASHLPTSVDRLPRHGQARVPGEVDAACVVLSKDSASPREAVRVFVTVAKDCTTLPVVVGLFRAPVADCTKPLAMKSLDLQPIAVGDAVPAVRCFQASFYAPRAPGAYDFRIFASDEEAALPIGRSGPLIVSIQAREIVDAVHSAHEFLLDAVCTSNIIDSSMAERCKAALSTHGSNLDIPAEAVYADRSGLLGLYVVAAGAAHSTSLQPTLESDQLYKIGNAIQAARAIVSQLQQIPIASTGEPTYNKSSGVPKPSVVYSAGILADCLWGLVVDIRFICLLCSMSVWRSVSSTLHLSSSWSANVYTSDLLTALDHLPHLLPLATLKIEGAVFSDLLTEALVPSASHRIPMLRKLCKRLPPHLTEALSFVLDIASQRLPKVAKAMVNGCHHQLQLLAAMHSDATALIDEVIAPIGLGKVFSGHPIRLQCMQVWRSSFCPLADLLLPLPWEHPAGGTNITPDLTLPGGTEWPQHVRVHFSDSLQQYMLRSLLQDVVDAPQEQLDTDWQLLDGLIDWNLQHLPDATSRATSFALPPQGDSLKKFSSILCEYTRERELPTSMSATHDNIRNTVETVANLLVPVGHPRARVHLFGSSGNGFGTIFGDVDLALDSSFLNVSQFSRLAALLTAIGMEDVHVRDSARFPVILFHDKETGIKVDLSLMNPLALANTQLLKVYSEADPRIKQTALCTKLWAKNRKLNDPSQRTLSSYAYVLMTLSRLLRASPSPIAISLQALGDGDHTNMVEAVDGQPINAYFHGQGANAPQLNQGL
jgi:hypothetical protein